MKILTCIFSYNRPLELANCAQSVEEYFPWGDRMILDDGSDQPLIDTVLEHWRERPNWRIVKFERDAVRRGNARLGGFYMNMRYALEYAVARDYDYCFFLECDSQVVWRDDSFPDRLRLFFDKCSEAIQVAPMFLERWIVFSQYEFIETLNAYRTPRGFNTTGIWHLDRVRSIPGFRIVDGTAPDDPLSDSYLPGNSRLCLENGFRFYWLRWPIVIRNMWLRSNSTIDTARRRDRVARILKGWEALIEPLSPTEIRVLRSSPGRCFAIQEFFSRGTGPFGAPAWPYRERWADQIIRYDRIWREEERAGCGGPIDVAACPTPADSKVRPAERDLRWGDPQEPREPGLLMMVASRLPEPAKRILKFLYRFVARRRLIMPWQIYGYIRLRRKLRREKALYREMAERGTRPQQDASVSEAAGRETPHAV